jgi:hypothetical protein
MHIPFISKTKPSPEVKKTKPNGTSDFEVLKEEEYQAVAGGPQVRNDPEG